MLLFEPFAFFDAERTVFRTHRRLHRLGIFVSSAPGILEFAQYAVAPVVERDHQVYIRIHRAIANVLPNRVQIFFDKTYVEHG